MSALIEHESIAEVPAFHGHQTSTSALVLDDGSIDRMMRVAEIMASGKATIPKHLQNSPGDCMAVVMQAMQWKMNPFAVGQKTHIVNGALGYEAQLVNAVLQATGAIKGRFHYEYRGEGNHLECRVAAIPAGESDLVWNEWLKISEVTVKNSPLWKTNPRQQMGYLQVKNWARATTPGAILGVYTTDELAERDITPRANSAPAAAAPATRTAQLKQRLASKPAPAALPAPSLDDVLLAISTAGGRAQMQAAKEMAGQLSEQDYAVAAQRYQQRVDELRAQAAPATSSASGFDLDGFKNKLASCNDIDTLDVMAADASSLADGPQLDEVSRLYAARRAELGA